MIDRYFVGFIILALILAKILMSFIGELDGNESNNKHLTTQEQKIKKADKRYFTKDSIGETVIRFKKEVSLDTKLKVIMRSNLYKTEVVSIMPDFELMKKIVSDRIEDKEASEYINSEIELIFDTYLSGEISTIEVKDLLLSIKAR